MAVSNVFSKIKQNIKKNAEIYIMLFGALNIFSYNIGSDTATVFIDTNDGRVELTADMYQQTREELANVEEKFIKLQTENDKLSRKLQTSTTDAEKQKEKIVDLENQMLQKDTLIEEMKLNPKVTFKNMKLFAGGILTDFAGEIAVIDNKNYYPNEFLGYVTNEPITYGENSISVGEEFTDKDSKILISSVDYFHKSGDMVILDNMQDNLNQSRMNVLGASNVTWKYKYKNKGYAKITGVFFVPYDKRDESGTAGSIEIKGDGVQLMRKEIHPYDEPIDINVNVSKYEEISIEFSSSRNRGLLSELYFVK